MQLGKIRMPRLDPGFEHHQNPELAAILDAAVHPVVKILAKFHNSHPVIENFNTYFKGKKKIDRSRHANKWLQMLAVQRQLDGPLNLDGDSWTTGSSIAPTMGTQVTDCMLRRLERRQDGGLALPHKHQSGCIAVGRHGRLRQTVVTRSRRVVLTQNRRGTPRQRPGARHAVDLAERRSRTVCASGASNKDTAQRECSRRVHGSVAVLVPLRPEHLGPDGVECVEFRGATIQQKKSNHIGPTGQRSGIKGSQG
ncbi:hypothetical protein DFH09DRAFT_1477853 [Mycena vulgaris]|nr:hypothetical protein DFH09DRAFT_1477853 [Mycena vulgaris]